MQLNGLQSLVFLPASLIFSQKFQSSVRNFKEPLRRVLFVQPGESSASDAHEASCAGKSMNKCPDPVGLPGPTEFAFLKDHFVHSK